MKNEKLIKSFTLLDKVEELQKGDVLVLKKFQGLIGLTAEELDFENSNSGKTLKLKWVLNNFSKVKVKEYFKTKEEKFDYIS